MYSEMYNIPPDITDDEEVEGGEENET